MNKKFFVFMMMFIVSCVVLFAATSVSGPVGDLGTKTASQRVVWTYSTEDIFEVGFSATEVTAANQNVTATAEDLQLSDNPSNTMDYFSGVGDVWVYWKIKSYEPIDITLKNEGAMKNGENSLNWKAKWNKKDNFGSILGDVTSGTIATDDETDATYVEGEVYSQDTRDNGENKLVVGSTKVTMETANANGKAEGAYAGTLTLKISTGE